MTEPMYFAGGKFYTPQEVIQEQSKRISELTAEVARLTAEVTRLTAQPDKE